MRLINHIISKIKKTIALTKHSGFKRTTIVVLNHLYWMCVNYQDEALDRKYGTDTFTKVAREDFEVENKELQYASNYEGISSRFFNRMMNHISINHQEYIFLDLGSGKGKALILAAKFPFKRIIGVDFSPKLHEIAKRNIDIFKTQNKIIDGIFKLYCIKAETFLFPQENTVLFLYNPFKTPIMSSVLSNLHKSLQIYPRNLIILYRNPVCFELFDKQPFLKLIEKNMHYRIYQNF